MNINKNFFWLIFLVVVSLVLGFLLGKNYRMMSPQYKILRTGQNKIDQALDIVTHAYVDTLNISKLTESAVKSVVSELDPHSYYIPASEVETANEDLEVSFSGIGVQFNMQLDTILIISIISGGPAEKAGLLPFDRIISINDSVVAGKGMSQNSLIRMLRGPKDSKVVLGIQRGNSEELAKFELIRGDIPNTSVDVAYKVTDKTGYIKVSKFARSTYHEFLTSLAKLQQQGATGFVVDLRDNPGGYMDAAINMVNEFLPKNRMIVYVEGHAYPRSDTYSNGKGSYQEAPLAVLINELSGSASEIFSGAIQDNDRAMILGRRSFGKGLVQTKFDMSDKSELMLTIGRYYTPSGRCIQKSYELGKADEYSLDIQNRYMHGESYYADSIKMNDSLAYKTSGGRTVYGGGGIMPDIFISQDTMNITSYYIKIVNTNVLYQFILIYSDKNRDKLSSFKTCEELYTYLKQQPLLNEFTNFAASKGIPRRPTLINISGKLIETQLCAYIVRNFFDNGGFYPIILKDDETLNKAVHIIENGQWKPEI